LNEVTKDFLAALHYRDIPEKVSGPWVISNALSMLKPNLLVKVLAGKIVPRNVCIMFEIVDRQFFGKLVCQYLVHINGDSM
jgi:hypothetical protein